MYLISAVLPAIYRSLLDSDPAKITSTIIGYSDIRLFDLPVSIKQSKRTKEEGKLIIHSHKKPPGGHRPGGGAEPSSLLGLVIYYKCRYYYD